MNWDLQDLKEKVTILKEKLNDTTDEVLKQEIKNELIIFDNMINEISPAKNTKPINVYLDVTNDIIDSKCDFFQKVIPSTTEAIELITRSKRLKLYWKSDAEIDYSEYKRLVEDFLKSFKFDLNTLYETMKKDNKINMTNNQIFGAYGMCYYFSILKESYIDVFYSGKVGNCEFLPHELGHAYLFGTVDYQEKYKMVMSSLGEAFPLFVQLAFYDYLKDSKYFKISMNYRRSFLESLSGYYEENVGKFLNSTVVKSSNGHFLNKNSEMLSEYSINRFLSKTLAYYLLYLYRNNEISKIDDFNNMYIKGQEYQFFEEIDPRLLGYSIKSEFDNFNDSIRAHKKLIKNK